LVQEAADFSTHEGNLAVDKLFDFDKSIFDLGNEAHLLFVLFFRNQAVLVKLKVFVLKLPKLVIKVFVKKYGRDFVMIFPLFFHMEFTVVNDLANELNKALNP
jgi:hypothetical protein